MSGNADNSALTGKVGLVVNAKAGAAARHIRM